MPFRNNARAAQKVVYATFYVKDKNFDGKNPIRRVSYL